MNSVPNNKLISHYEYVIEEEIINHLKNGWILYGSPFFDPRIGVPVQAMIRVREICYDSD